MVVKSLEDFNDKLAAANAQGKSVMLDLYADWCVACKEFAKYTFPDPAVVAALQNTVLMQIDLTDNTEQNLQFQEHFFILGLPTILFFDVSGEELSSARITGFMKADAFAQHLRLTLK
jgi:thioredoxin:protein disulfide reductase